MGFRFPNAHDAELHLTQTAGNNIVTNQGFDAATWHPWAADLPPQPICPREPKGGRGEGGRAAMVKRSSARTGGNAWKSAPTRNEMIIPALPGTGAMQEAPKPR
jgi:hypothetical protein